MGEIDLTIIIPFWHGNDTLQILLDSIPDGVPVIIVCDAGSPVPEFERDGVMVLKLGRRGYFSGACNLGINATRGDVLILNQDAKLGNGWRNVIESNRDKYAAIGEGVFSHPAWPSGYAQGTFLYMRRDAINKIGLFNAELYPLWGATCEWQLRAHRAGLNVLALENVRGFSHADKRNTRYGSAIEQALNEEPENKEWFTHTPPEISVIIPCFNYGRYLLDAIDSLMRQSFQSFEAIIVDDASTDNSAEIAQSLVDPLKGIRFIQNIVNVGVAATINNGIKGAYGKYITVLSADDMYKPERLEVLYQAAKDNPGRVIYDDMVWSVNGNETPRQMREYKFSELLNSNIMHAGIFYPRQAWARAGGYPEIMRDGREDWAFNIALGAVGYCGLRVPRAMYIYRRDGQNRSLRNQMGRFEYRLYELFPNLYDGECNVCDCTGGSSRRKPSNQINAKQRPPGADVLVEYIGKNKGSEIWRIPSTGRRMVFSHSPRHNQRWVTKPEADYLIKSGAFRIIVGEAIEPHKFGEVENDINTQEEVYPD